MKLRNKKTGEIADLEHRGLLKSDNNNYIIVYPDGTLKYYAYNSLAELNEEWEDYEEPKNFWYIDDFMIMCGAEGEFTTPDLASFTRKDIKKLKAIGNYFETKEEAELAVRKLKAWKRLKDKGFRFTGVAGMSNNIFVSFETDSKYRGGHVMYDEHSNTDNKLKEYNEDLTLLFGGEE